MLFKTISYRGGKYTDKVFKTAEDARAYASKRKQGVIVLAKGFKWKDGTTTWIIEEVLKGEVKTIRKERDDYFNGKVIVGKTLDEYFGQWHRRCGRYVVTISEHTMNISVLRFPVVNIIKTDSGFLKTVEYRIDRNYLVIAKNEMMTYGFEDFFEQFGMTDEEEAFLRGQYTTAETLTTPMNWDEWRRYEAICGGDKF